MVVIPREPLFVGTDFEKKEEKGNTTDLKGSLQALPTHRILACSLRTTTVRRSHRPREHRGLGQSSFLACGENLHYSVP